MNKENICCIIGHDRWYYDIIVKYLIEIKIRELIQSGVNSFLNLGKNGFDICCALIINKVKQDFPFVKHYQVTSQIISCEKKFLFDNTIYVNKEISTKPDKVSWMLTQSGHALCFVQHSLGMAETYMHMAEKSGLKIHRITPPAYHYPHK